MPKSRKRYVGRAEKLRNHKRVYWLIWSFGLLAFAVWVLFSWRSIYDYLRSYFM